MPHSADLAIEFRWSKSQVYADLRHVRSQSRNSPEALALRLRAKHSDRNYIHSIIVLIRELADPTNTAKNSGSRVRAPRFLSSLSFSLHRFRRLRDFILTGLNFGMPPPPSIGQFNNGITLLTGIVMIIPNRFYPISGRDLAYTNRSRMHRFSNRNPKSLPIADKSSRTHAQHCGRNGRIGKIPTRLWSGVALDPVPAGPSPLSDR